MGDGFEEIEPDADQITELRRLGMFGTQPGSPLGDGSDFVGVVAMPDVWPSICKEREMQSASAFAQVSVFPVRHWAGRQPFRYRGKVDPFFESTSMEQRTGAEPPHAEQLTVNQGFPKLGLGISMSGEDIGVSEPDLWSGMDDFGRSGFWLLPECPVDTSHDRKFAVRQRLEGIGI